MPKYEKFSNRMESISSVNSDVFTAELRVNRSVWRRLPFGIQCKINKLVSELNEVIYYNIESTYQEMLLEQSEQNSLREQLSLIDASVESLPDSSPSLAACLDAPESDTSVLISSSDACIDTTNPEAVATKNDSLVPLDKKNKKS